MRRAASRWRYTRGNNRKRAYDIAKKLLVGSSSVTTNPLILVAQWPGMGFACAVLFPSMIILLIGTGQARLYIRRTGYKRPAPQEVFLHRPPEMVPSGIWEIYRKPACRRRDITPQVCACNWSVYRFLSFLRFPFPFAYYSSPRCRVQQALMNCPCNKTSICLNQLPLFEFLFRIRFPEA